MITQAEEKNYLSLCKEIQKINSAFRAKHRGSVEIFDAGIEKRRRENQHLLDLQKLRFEDSLLNRLSLDFLPILESYKVFDQEESQRFSDNLEKFNSSELVYSILHRDWQNLKSLSTKYQLGTDFLLFVGLNLVQTVLPLYAERLKPKVDHENWLKGDCPVCGSFPAMEKFRREDGKRILWCGLCGMEWHFKRLSCPFCGNEDHNTLRFFLVEQDSASIKDGFRVDVCDRCKRYIKTLDERKLPESERPELYTENLNTIYLDVLAQNDGYQSPSFWMIALSEESFAWKLIQFDQKK